MRSLRTSAPALLAAFVLAACSETTAPPLDPDGLQADLVSAEGAAAAPATVSFTALGHEIDAALRAAGGGSAVIDLPAALVRDPKALLERAELQARVREQIGEAAVIPPSALGGTFEWSVELGRYAKGTRTGAPANGVRFILYAVDPATEEIIVPLVETGYADLTRTVSGTSATARIEVWGGGAGGAAPTKVLDYAVTVSGTVVAPSVLVAGFARNGADSLAFSLTSALRLADQAITLDWRAALPARGLSSRVQQAILGGTAPSITIDGRITSRNGNVQIAGTLVRDTGGTLDVNVNGRAFALITFSGTEDEDPVITNPQGEPLTEREAHLLRHIIDWFEDLFDVFEDLLDPVEHLLDLAF